MNDWKYYEVTARLSWMDGGCCCEADLTMKTHAKSVGHAISRVKDHLVKIGMHEVEDCEAKLTEL